jgi:predicted site-specific integrase-resolvase
MKTGALNATAQRVAQQTSATIRNSMKYTLSQAATATGNNKATIQRAIKSGKISAKKNSSGAYEIDPSELHRIFPATAQRRNALHNRT